LERQPVIDRGRGAKPIERVAIRGGGFAKTKEPVGELFSIIDQNQGDAQNAGAF
jgi:hypothetical protein